MRKISITSTVKFISTKPVIFPSRLHFQNITFISWCGSLLTTNKADLLMFFYVRLLIRLHTCARREMSMVGQVAFSKRFSKKFKNILNVLHLLFTSIYKHEFLIFNHTNSAIANINHCLSLSLNKTDNEMSFNSEDHSTH